MLGRYDRLAWVGSFNMCLRFSVFPSFHLCSAFVLYYVGCIFMYHFVLIVFIFIFNFHLVLLLIYPRRCLLITFFTSHFIVICSMTRTLSLPFLYVPSIFYPFIHFLSLTPFVIYLMQFIVCLSSCIGRVLSLFVWDVLPLDFSSLWMYICWRLRINK